MGIHQYVIKSRSQLGSKSYIFMEITKSFPSQIFLNSYYLQNIYLNEKTEFILPYLVRNFQRMKQTNSKVAF